jgi:predicted nucleotidyltransferase
MNSDFKELLQYFNDNSVEYLIVGGYAVIEYTEPRYTKDLDLWIRVSPENARAVFQALARFGAPLSGMSPTDFEEEGYVYQVGVAPVRVDILMSIDGMTFNEAWPNRNTVDFGGVTAWVIGREDLIRAKRASGRSQDLIDADNLEANQG